MAVVCTTDRVGDWGPMAVWWTCEGVVRSRYGLQSCNVSQITRSSSGSSLYTNDSPYREGSDPGPDGQLTTWGDRGVDRPSQNAVENGFYCVLVSVWVVLVVVLVLLGVVLVVVLVLLGVVLVIVEVVASHYCY